MTTEACPNNPKMPRKFCTCIECSKPPETPVDKRWTYCPECGSTEIRHAEGDHKQCACCLQEWFADIDYTDVVRTNLGNRMQLRSSLTARDEALASIRVFAQDCIENGYFCKGSLGNLYGIRDLCDLNSTVKEELK